MKPQELHLEEEKRLAALASYQINTAEPQLFLDNITSLTASICKTPIAMISLVGEKEQVFISRKGIRLTHTPREHSFCGAAIMQDDIFEINEINRKEFFTDRQFLNGEFRIRYYAGVPLKDPAGYNIGTLCVIDNRKRSLSKVQKSYLRILAAAVMDCLVLKKNRKELDFVSNELSKFFLISPDLICIATPDGYFSKVSDSFIKDLGYAREELLSKPFIDFVHPDDVENTLDKLKDINENSAVVLFFRNRYRCKNGSYIWLSWNSTRDNETGLIFAIARNVTDLVKLNEELDKKRELETRLTEEKYAQLSLLTSNISHEILNPVNMIIGFSEMTIDLLQEFNNHNEGLRDSSIINQVLVNQEKIMDHGRLIFNTIHRMNYDVSRSDFAAVALPKPDQKQDVNLLCSEFYRIAYNNFTGQHPGFNCAFETHLDSSEPKCKITITDLGESVMNLYYNAFEALMKKEKVGNGFIPKVSVSTGVARNKIEIIVKNNGVEIPKENSSRIFNPFFTTKIPSEGHGLGLTASYGLIKKNNGSLILENSTPEITSFKIVLPSA